jgi:hypothetical protein
VQAAALKGQQEAEEDVATSLGGCAELQQELVSWQQQAQGQLQQLEVQLQELQQAAAAAEAQAEAEAEAEELKSSAVSASSPTSRSSAVSSTDEAMLTGQQQPHQELEQREWEQHWPTFDEFKADQERVPLQQAVQATEQQLQAYKKDTTSKKVQLDLKAGQIRDYQLLVPAAAGAAAAAGNGNGNKRGAGSSSVTAAAVTAVPAAVKGASGHPMSSTAHVHHVGEGSPVCDRCGQVIDLEMYQR